MAALAAPDLVVAELDVAVERRGAGAAPLDFDALVVPDLVPMPLT